MSNFTDFVSDFPARCSDLLSTHEMEAVLQGREVTLMLALAASGFNIPFERLRPTATEDPVHPSGDRSKFPQARARLDALLGDDSFFIGSSLWGEGPKSWLAGKVQGSTDDPDSWPNLAFKPKRMTDKKTVKAVLSIIRNALAHGNIYTRGSDSAIEQLVFISRPIGAREYNFIAVSPHDFRAFLFRWFDYLKTLHMPGKIVTEVLEYAF